MSKLISLPPNAEKMVQSMRALGYSFQTALADVIDNSISAGATHVDILTPTDPSENAYLAILDNGSGMDEPTLIESMRHASKNPNENRKTEDLGRFGLGMKTASLSQCREFIVVTRTKKGTYAAGWSIDTIQKEQDWSLTIFNESEYKKFPCFEIFNQLEHGTLLIWHKFDRFSANSGSCSDELTSKLIDARDHLGLVYHRFISDPDNPIVFTVNGRRIEAKDPFLENRKSGVDALPPEQIFIPEFPNTPIVVTGYTLPHQNRITASEMTTLGLRDRSFGEDQGFYIYRGKRLIFWGGWLRLARKAQASKLCRVCVDVPNSMDNIWELDIKKSIAIPPRSVRDKLAGYLDILVKKSRDIQTGRGTHISLKPENLVWDACIIGKTQFAVRLNKDFGIYKELLDSLDSEQRRLLHCYLGMVELFYPSRWVSSQYCGDKSSVYSDAENTDSIQLLKDVLNGICSDSTTIEELRDFVQIMKDNSAVADNKQLTNSVVKNLKLNK